MVAAFLAKIQGDPAPSINGDAITNGSQTEQPGQSPLEEKQRANSKQVQRLVDWNVEMLQRLLVSIIAKRKASGQVSETDLPPLKLEEGKSYLDEVVEVIEFAPFDAATSPDKLDPDSVELDVAAATQLRAYVEFMASKFHDNHFHAFERGSQVTMTLRKHLSRALMPKNAETARELYDRTSGISQDPLAQFALVFAALFHDVDHPGVPNSQLIRMNSELAMKYKNRSVTELNALDTAWTVLMKPDFADLRGCIYGSLDEMKKFRQLLVNSFLATDCVDDELVTMRKNRWEKAFVVGKGSKTSETRNLQATVVLEMLMSSSDIFYSIQNWHLFQKWNERQFYEMYKAYQTGRLAQDPCIFWYKSVLLFFDEHVISVTKQMHECGFLDFSGDEQLSFALANRQQWAAKGGNLVASMVARYHGREIEIVRAKRVHRRMSLTATQA
jgi:3'5'-cyclic nucleotide phosphodiesterase